ncbi:MAG: FAD-binding protein [Cohaesibacter sp.]|nr:FAD-binding protein [Cohaesibacter sp.]
MILTIPHTILDRLTDVEMPRLPAEPHFQEQIKVADTIIPVHQSGAVVVGSGAAGLRAAVELHRRDGNVTILSQSAWGGTSACSGSDKQTLHTANSSDQGDDFKEMAKAIRAGGAMDEDTAYIEAVGSVRSMASLQFLGLPLPQDQLGGTLRYQTDHDEIGRATSCGPRTSRLMVKVLAQEAIRLGIPFFNQTICVRILFEEKDGEQVVAGLLAVRPKAQSKDNPFGFVIFQSSSIILAAGGPGELYRDSVFPNGCFGSLGLALQAGVELVNLTESQFGIGTRREGFPWNLSGTYVQVMPHIYSLDDEDNEHHFLADYYRSTQEMVSNIFRKGYQWPFHATRMADFQSSLVDLAVFCENQKGRRVFMDFNRNPLPVPGDLPFSLERLDEDVSLYLTHAKADQALPIDRLRHMNPLAIELYRRYKVDIAKDPLEFAVNNQHMNGGIAVDIWGQSNCVGLYAVGEAAGTHGVTRPGGSALNAGQVFGTRAAEHISGHGMAIKPQHLIDPNCIKDALLSLEAILKADSPLHYSDIRKDVQARMSDRAGILCTAKEVHDARIEAKELNARISTHGIAYDRISEAGRVLQWHQMALVSEAVLAALDHYISHGGGSRGARAICDPAGEITPMARSGPLTDYCFVVEKDEDRKKQILVHLQDDAFLVSERENRSFDEGKRSFFERDWPAWLTGSIYQPSSDL